VPRSLHSSRQGSVSHQWCDLFYRLLHRYTRHIEGVEGEERDILLVHKNEAMVAWPEAIAHHKPRRQSGVIKAHTPPPLIVRSHGQKSETFRKRG
jgi:hypothetical protein